eukprot:6488286-Amphidinium_carterae.1
MLYRVTQPPHCTVRTLGTYPALSSVGLWQSTKHASLVSTIVPSQIMRIEANFAQYDIPSGPECLQFEFKTM